MEQVELVERPEFKPGEPVLVSNTSEVFASNRKDTYQYVGMDHKGVYIVENEKGTLSRWQFAVSPVRVVPWTYDTLPKLPFMVCGKDENYRCKILVTSVDDTMLWLASASEGVTYQELLDDFNYIPDQYSGTQYPCGETVGGHRG